MEIKMGYITFLFADPLASEGTRRLPSIAPSGMSVKVFQ
jgi:hypothetical protein